MEINEPSPSEIQRFARVLTIAGSDSGGCAGIQADLRTFATLQTHGLCAVTSITAQDTEKVHSCFDIPERLVSEQIKVVLDDIGADAVKTGMLSSSAIIGAVASQLRRYKVNRLVVDPVMAATGGGQFIDPEAIHDLVLQLFPLAAVITPNLQEAEVLLERSLRTSEELRLGAQDLHRLGPRSVIIKGGHIDDPDHSTDLLYDGSEFHLLTGPRIRTSNTHGSGCTFAAAIAAYLARGLPIVSAAFKAREYVQRAIQYSYPLGKGNGPLGHFGAG